MIKKALYIILVLYAFASYSQTKYYTNAGQINFEASVSSFEEVKATSNTVTSILDVNKSEIAALALVKGFRFKVALMEEHFNESYAETNTFPKATFSGKIDQFSVEDLGAVTRQYQLDGTLTFHGKSIEIHPILSISQNENSIFLSSTFLVKPEDFDIKIPRLLRKKVAETVKVTLNFELEPKG